MCARAHTPHTDSATHTYTHKHIRTHAYSHAGQAPPDTVKLANIEKATLNINHESGISGVGVRYSNLCVKNRPGSGGLPVVVANS